ncbi:MAG TPA: diguanylate cyclase [Gammaproteobacteria bacterium]|nr:diguanylate cyclase [Gammaproteobacteria bacterium]
MSETLCHKYGFDEAARRERLALARLGDDDQALAVLLREEVISPHVQQLVADFYAWLMDFPVASQYLQSDEQIRRLQQTQTDYLLSLGQDFASEAYFERRLLIGMIHVNIGLPLSLYQCAYGWMRDHISILIHQSPALNATQKLRLASFLSRIMTLDETLATESYHLERVGELEASLSSMARERAKLSEQVDRDSLTGVASRPYIMRRLEQQLGRTPPAVFSLMMIDLDHFKDVNDRHGHLVGDNVLREVAGRIRGATRDLDLVGRYGGEEFMILLPATSLETAVRIADRVREAVAATPLHTREANVPMTISIGVTQSTPVDTSDTLIGRADYALYQAKEAGRNRVNVA